MRVLVAYASKRGATEDMAARIAREIGGDEMSRPSTRGKEGGAALIITIILTAVALASCALPDIRVSTPPFNGLADGAYTGSYDGGMVKATVEATIASGAITRIDILKHECGTGKPAERIVEDVVAAQSLDVDVVAGATYSSKVILKAIEVALTEAL